MRATIADNSALTPSFGEFLRGENLPFSATPSVRRNEDEFWVHIGSGRFYVQEDNLVSQQQRLFGIKEDLVNGFPSLLNSVQTSELTDVTGIDVFEDGVLQDQGGSLQVTLSSAAASENVATFDDALSFIRDNSKGWKLDYRDPGVPANISNGPDTTDNRLFPNPRIRTNTKIAYGGTTLVNTAYEGTGELCRAEGNGILLTPHLAVGLPAPFAPLGVDEGDRSPLSPSDSPDRSINSGTIVTSTWVLNFDSISFFTRL